MRELVEKQSSVGLKQLFAGIPDKQVDRCLRVIKRLTLERRQLEMAKLEGEIELLENPVDESEALEAPDPLDMDGVTLEEAVKAFERRILVKVLQECAGNQYKASRRLGTTRRILSYKVAQFGICAKEFKAFR